MERLRKLFVEGGRQQMELPLKCEVENYYVIPNMNVWGLKTSDGSLMISGKGKLLLRISVNIGIVFSPHTFIFGILFWLQAFEVPALSSMERLRKLLDFSDVQTWRPRSSAGSIGEPHVH
jgi:hypothetical protein